MTIALRALNSIAHRYSSGILTTWGLSPTLGAMIGKVQLKARADHATKAF
jgi:hypothetical protein